jgi:hypothetical protein
VITGSHGLQVAGTRGYRSPRITDRFGRQGNVG